MTLQQQVENLWVRDENNGIGVPIDSDTVDQILKIIDKAQNVTSDTSDGYHTFNELYEFRMLYNAHLFNEWGKHKTYPVVKSKRHSGGELCFGGGWFIVVAQLPSGQISNHYKLEYWDLFDIKECEKVPWEFDDHTPQDVAKRLLAELSSNKDTKLGGDDE